MAFTVKYKKHTITYFNLFFIIQEYFIQDLDQAKSYDIYWPNYNIENVLKYYRKSRNKKRTLNSLYFKIVNYNFDVQRRLLRKL